MLGDVIVIVTLVASFATLGYQLWRAQTKYDKLEVVVRDLEGRHRDDVHRHMQQRAADNERWFERCMQLIEFSKAPTPGWYDQRYPTAQQDDAEDPDEPGRWVNDDEGLVSAFVADEDLTRENA